jgi:hypothetical protein
MKPQNSNHPILARRGSTSWKAFRSELLRAGALGPGARSRERVGLPNRLDSRVRAFCRHYNIHLAVLFRAAVNHNLKSYEAAS